MLLATYSDHCTPDGSFTPDERRRIHTRLLALDDAVGESYNSDGPHWHISRVSSDDLTDTPTRCRRATRRSM